MATSTVLKKFSMVAAGAAILAFSSAFTTTQKADAAPGQSGAVRSGFNSTQLPRNDDGSTGAVNIGFTTNFFGRDFNQLFVNNNGNITFGRSLSSFTPFGLTGNTAVPIIAPFFADVDTRNPGSGITAYGTGTVNGYNAFGATWNNVGYYNNNASHLNSFQTVLIDRSDTGAGNFDIEFNYDQINWESGTASGGNSNGLGGNSARAGFSNGTGATGSFFELTGSGVNGAFLNGGSNALRSNSLNSDVNGRYVFSARNGTVVQAPTSVPEPASILGLFAVGAMGTASTALKRKQQQKVATKV